MNRLRAPFNVNLLAQRAALAALADDEHVERTRAMNRDGMRQLCGWVRRAAARLCTE